VVKTQKRFLGDTDRFFVALSTFGRPQLDDDNDDDDYDTAAASCDNLIYRYLRFYPLTSHS
jgi:hypothetical protein